MRILSVAQSLLLAHLQGKHTRPFLARGAGLLGGLSLGQAAQVGRDCAVVGGSMCVDLRSQFEPQRVRWLAGRSVDVGQNPWVIEGVDHDCNAAFSRSEEHTSELQSREN